MARPRGFSSDRQQVCASWKPNGWSDPLFLDSFDDWLVVSNIFYFSINMGIILPNWRTHSIIFFRVVSSNHQPVFQRGSTNGVQKVVAPRGSRRPATWDAWAPRDGWSMAVCRRPCPWHIWWRPGLWGWENHGKSMGLLRFDGNFTMISSIQHGFFMGKNPQVLWWCFLFFCKTHCGTLGL